MTTDKLKILQETRQVCLFQSKCIGELALWAVNKIVDKNPGSPGATDGRAIYFYDPFFQLSLGERAFVYMHELMHIAFRHPQRAQGYCTNHSDRIIWNWAADIIINESLNDIPWLSKHILPGALRFSTLAQFFPEVYALLPPDRTTLTVEVLFDLLKSCAQGQTEKLEEMLGSIDLMSNSESKADNELTIHQDGDSKDSLPDELEEAFMADLLERIQSYGDESAKELFKFKGELPKVKTPWSKYLSSFLRKHLVKGYHSDWTKPNRLSLSGVVDCFLPSSRKEVQYKPLVIAVDLSGSCWSEKVQAEFYANVDRIQKFFQCPIVLVSFDTEIHNVYEFKAGKNTFKEALRGLNFNGSGGTSFVELFHKVWVDDEDKTWEISPECMVVLTDLYGCFPENKPKFPVLWAVLSGGSAEAPFGKVVQLT